MSVVNQYSIIDILIVNTFFSREYDIDFLKEIVNKTNFEKKVSQTTLDSKPVIMVELIVKVSGWQDEKQKEVYTSEVKACGMFEKIGEPALLEETFSNINAPAIIYPFIREHICNLSLKSGINKLFLPPVNFFKVD